MNRPLIPARPTVYKGAKMRSRLEADYASALDRDEETWEYEPACFAGSDGQWLPDFRVGSDGVYTEVKPAYLIEWGTPDFFDPLVIGASRRARLWYLYTPSTVDLPLLWPGMGQALTVIKHGELAGGAR